MNFAFRETWRGRVWRISAFRLVDEQDDLLVLWHTQGGTVLRPFDDRRRELRIPGDGDWRLELRPSSDSASWPTGLENFRPDPAWPPPELPEGWDVV